MSLFLFSSALFLFFRKFRYKILCLLCLESMFLGVLWGVCRSGCMDGQGNMSVYFLLSVFLVLDSVLGMVILLSVSRSSGVSIFLLY